MGQWIIDTNNHKKKAGKGANLGTFPLVKNVQGGAGGGRKGKGGRNTAPGMRHREQGRRLNAERTVSPMTAERRKRGAEARARNGTHENVPPPFECPAGEGRAEVERRKRHAGGGGWRKSQTVSDAAIAAERHASSCHVHTHGLLTMCATRIHAGARRHHCAEITPCLSLYAVDPSLRPIRADSSILSITACVFHDTVAQ